MAGIVYRASLTTHASVYGVLVKKHTTVRREFVVTLTGFSLAFALPLAVWIISGFAGEFVQFDALSLWQLTWVIWAVWFEITRDAARYAQCSTAVLY